MQNRYAGDVGDFGKIGMLRCIEKCGICDFSPSAYCTKSTIMIQ